MRFHTTEAESRAFFEAPVWTLAEFKFHSQGANKKCPANLRIEGYVSLLHA